MAAKGQTQPKGSALPFALRYQWFEGSVPPPYHYEWIIELSSEQGKITFYSDYPQQGIEPWVRSFRISPGQIKALIDTMHTSRVFRHTWQQPEQAPVGGAYEYLTVWRDGKTYQVPAKRTAGANRALEPVWKALKLLVPQPVWDELFRLREEAILSSGH